MKKWLPIIIICLIVLSLKVPGYIMKKSVERSLAELQVPTKPPAPIASKTAELPVASKPIPWVARSLAKLPVASNPLPPDAGKTYENSANGFSIVFPQDWTVKEPLLNGAIVIKAIRSGDDHKLATLNIKKHQIDSSVDFRSITPQQLFDENCANEGPLLDSATENVNGRIATWFETKYTIFGFQSYAVTFVLENDGTIFCLQGIIVTEDPAWIDANALNILQSIRSFKFTK